MPTGKVKFYDTEKGFGFISGDDGVDVFLPSAVLPSGTTSLKGGTKVEYGIVEGRRGAQALSVTVLDQPASVSANRRERDRRDPDDMVIIVEDVIKLLDNVSETLRRGRYPDKSVAAKTAQVLRAVAADLD